MAVPVSLPAVHPSPGLSQAFTPPPPPAHPEQPVPLCRRLGRGADACVAACLPLGLELSSATVKTPACLLQACSEEAGARLRVDAWQCI